MHHEIEQFQLDGATVLRGGRRREVARPACRRRRAQPGPSERLVTLVHQPRRGDRVLERLRHLARGRALPDGSSSRAGSPICRRADGLDDGTVLPRARPGEGTRGGRAHAVAPRRPLLLRRRHAERQHVDRARSRTGIVRAAVHRRFTSLGPPVRAPQVLDQTPVRRRRRAFRTAARRRRTRRRPAAARLGRRARRRASPSTSARCTAHRATRSRRGAEQSACGGSATTHLRRAAVDNVAAVRTGRPRRSAVHSATTPDSPLVDAADASRWSAR